jgi:hypothetical protein
MATSSTEFACFLEDSDQGFRCTSKCDDCKEYKGVGGCDCPALIACEICGERKNLDGDFWKNKKNKQQYEKSNKS